MCIIVCIGGAVSAEGIPQELNPDAVTVRISWFHASCLFWADRRGFFCMGVYESLRYILLIICSHLTRKLSVLLIELRGGVWPVNSHAIVSSSVGPEYYVNILSFVDKGQLEPGCAVLMHNKVLSIVGTLADDTDPLVSVMKVRSGVRHTHIAFHANVTCLSSCILDQ